MVYMIRHVDPEITAKQMKMCSGFLTDYSFEEFRSIDTMTDEQCAYLKKLIAEIEKGEKELYEYIPEAEEFFGKSHPLYVSNESDMSL